MEYLKIPISFYDFDSSFYINTHKDLKGANINTPQQAFFHWLNFGSHEGREYKCLKTNTVQSIRLTKNQRFHSPVDALKITRPLMSSMPSKHNVSSTTHATHHSVISSVPASGASGVSGVSQPVVTTLIKQNVSSPSHTAHHSIKVNTIKKASRSVGEKRYVYGDPVLNGVNYVKRGEKPNKKIITNPVDINAPKTDIKGIKDVKGHRIVSLDGGVICVMLYLFDIKMIRFFNSGKIEKLIEKYGEDQIHIYVGVQIFENRFVPSSSPSFDPLVVDKYIHDILGLGAKHVTIQKYMTADTRGGDIGSFIQLSKLARETGGDIYKWYMFIHSKTNFKWRCDLTAPLFNASFEKLDRSCGLYGSSKWLLSFNSSTCTKYTQHFNTLRRVFGMDGTCINQWQFVGGTMFILNDEIVKYIVLHGDEVYKELNTHHTPDYNWIINVEKTKKDRHGCVNDYEYRLRYGKSLLSDYMIEHACERFIGLIVAHLGFKVGRLT